MPILAWAHLLIYWPILYLGHSTRQKEGTVYNPLMKDTFHEKANPKALWSLEREWFCPGLLTSLRISRSDSHLILEMASWWDWCSLLRSPALILSAWIILLSASSTCFLAVFRSAISCNSLRRSASNSFRASSRASMVSAVLTLSLLPSRSAHSADLSLWISPSRTFTVRAISCSCCLMRFSRTACSSFIFSSWSLALSSVTRTVCLRCSSSRILLASWVFSLSSLDTWRQRGERMKRGEPHQTGVLLGRTGSSGPCDLLMPHLFSNSSPLWKERGEPQAF